MADRSNGKNKIDYAALGIKALKVDQDMMVLTSDSQRQKAAIKNLIANRGQKKKMLKKEQVASFLNRWMTNLLDRVRIDGALTQDKVAGYLAAFTTTAMPVLGVIYGAKQEQTIQRFENNSKIIVEKIAHGGKLPKREVSKYQYGISEKSKQLYDKAIDERAKIVEDIGMDLTKAHEASQQDQKEIKKRVSGFEEAIVPMGFGVNPPRIPILDFFKMPFGTGGKHENNWFGQHFEFLALMVKQGLLARTELKKIKSLQPYAPKIRYKRYVDIFPQDNFDEAGFTAVFNVWQNNGLVKLRGAAV